MGASWLRKKEVKDKRIDETSIAIKAGLPPGTLVHTGSKKPEHFRIKAINYSEQFAEEFDLKLLEDCSKYMDSGTNSWINFDGINHVEKVERVGGMFGMHMLIMEDIVNTEQRPKMELLDDHLFLILKMLSLDRRDGRSEIISEQVSFVLGKSWLLSFQEEEGDVFEAVRERIRKPAMRIRKQATDYLLYRLVDTVVDNYFIIAEYISDNIELLEDEILERPGEDQMRKVQEIRRDILILRKAVMPLRELLMKLSKEENNFVKKSTMRYFHDTYEHTVHLADFIDTQRDLLASLVELFNSTVGQKMNQIMKVLTIIATIFIPLTFIAGIYGMNFENMPELGWENGYYFTLSFMGLLLLGMLFYFRRKGWF